MRPHGRLKQYELLGPVGVGRVGLLLLAASPLDTAQRVLHIPYLRYQRRLGFGQRYLGDALWAATADLPGFCLPTHCDCTDELVFSARPHLEGATLAALMRHMRPRRAQLSRRMILSIVLELARSLERLHRAGPELSFPACHGRLSPSRVMLCSDGQLQILGLPSPVGWMEGPWLSPLEGCRLCELPPERLEGHPATPASDAYQLSLLLYTLWLLRNPHDRRTRRETLSSVFSGTPRLEDSMRMGPRLRSLLLDGLSEGVDQRPSLPQLIHQLSEQLEEDGGPVSLPERAALLQRWIPSVPAPPAQLLHTQDAEMLLGLLQSR